MTLAVPPLAGAVAWDDAETLIGTLAPTGAVGPWEVVAIGPEALAWAAAAEAADATVAGAWPAAAEIAGGWPAPAELAGAWPAPTTIQGRWP